MFRFTPYRLWLYDRTLYARWVRCYKTDLLKRPFHGILQFHGIDMSWGRRDTVEPVQLGTLNNIYKATYMYK